MNGRFLAQHFSKDTLANMVVEMEDRIKDYIILNKEKEELILTMKKENFELVDTIGALNSQLRQIENGIR